MHIQLSEKDSISTHPCMYAKKKCKHIHVYSSVDVYHTYVCTCICVYIHVCAWMPPCTYKIISIRCNLGRNSGWCFCVIHIIPRVKCAHPGYKPNKFTNVLAKSLASKCFKPRQKHTSPKRELVPLFFPPNRFWVLCIHAPGFKTLLKGQSP